MLPIGNSLWIVSHDSSLYVIDAVHYIHYWSSRGNPVATPSIDPTIFEDGLLFALTDLAATTLRCDC